MSRNWLGPALALLLAFPDATAAGDRLVVISAPTIVGAGGVSSGSIEFATAIDGQGVLYFNRVAVGRMHVRRAVHGPDGWTEMGEVAFTASDANDIDPFVSRDGNRIYFSSNRQSGVATAANYDIWFAEKTAAGWGPPLRAAALGSPTDDIYISEDRAGTLYFTRFGDGDAANRSVTLMRSRREGEGFSAPASVSIGSEGGALINPAISPDGLWLVMAETGPGGPHLMVSHHEVDGRWTAFAPLKDEAGAPLAGFAPYISNDSRYLYFTREVAPGADGAVNRDLFRVGIRFETDR